MNLFNLLFNQLRYEGHTPLWYLLLAIPAKLGVPYELGMKMVCVIFSTAGVALLVRKSPFRWHIRYLLPFSYFLFYQYGVVSRSYCLLAPILWCLAIYFAQKDRKPYLYALLLSLLGGVSAHGILLGGSIALAWLIVILREQAATKDGSFLKRMARDRRVKALALYGLSLVFYAVLLWPPTDRMTLMLATQNHLPRLLYTLLIGPLDSLATDYGVLINYGAPWQYAILPAIACFAGLVYFFSVMHRKKLFLVTFLSFISLCLFFALIYFNYYHQGIYVLWMVFCAWLAVQTKTDKKERNLANFPAMVRRILRRMAPGILLAVLLLQVAFSAVASVNDILLPYDSGRNMAQYIKEHKLQGARIMNAYGIVDGYGNAYTDHDIAILPYFSTNLYYNFNYGDSAKSYNTNQMPTGQEPLRWKEGGAPDYFFFDYDNQLFSTTTIRDYTPVINPDDYVKIASFDSYKIWKIYTVKFTHYIYARRDIAAQRSPK